MLARRVLCVAVVVAGCSSGGSSTASLDQIEAEIVKMMTPSNVQVLSVGKLATAVGVDLRADAQDIAATLYRRYGTRVVIRLGRFPYPPGTTYTTGVGPMPCSPASSRSPSPPDLAVQIELSAPSLRSGADLHGKVRITNHRSTPVRIRGSSPIRAVLVRPGTTTVAGMATGVIGGVGIESVVQPGQAITVDLIVGSATCDETAGYSLAPGTYDVAVIDSDLLVDDSTGQPLVPGPAPLTIIS